MPRKSAADSKARIATDVVLFDSYSVVFRAFHALPPLSTSTGVPSSALYGFSSLVLKVLREQRPSELAFALDGPQRTFRAERYPEYKAGRPRTPSALSQELERLPRLLEAFEVPVFCAPGFEADDVLATLARRIAGTGRQVLVVSGGRDLLQTAGERTRVLFLGRRAQPAELYDATRVEARFGVPPAKLPAFVALVGDPSDHLVADRHDYLRQHRRLHVHWLKPPACWLPLHRRRHAAQRTPPRLRGRSSGRRARHWS